MEHDSKAEEIIQSIKTDDALRAYFFRRAANSSHPAKWLDLLALELYFEASQNPGIEWSEDKKSYTIPHWQVLEYLLNLAKWSRANNAIAEQKKVMEIFDAVTKPISGERTQNPYTDWMMLQVLITFPIAEIEHRIGFVRVALESRMQFSLSCSTIVKETIPALIAAGSEEAVIETLRAFLDFRCVDGRIAPLVEEYWIADLKHGVNIRIAEFLGSIAPIECIRIIAKLNRCSPNTLGTTWPSRVVPENNFHQYDYEYVLIDVFLNMCEALGESQIREVLSELLQQVDTFFLRLALWIMSNRYEVIHDVFWHEWFPKVTYTFPYEWYYFLKANATKFTNEESARIVDKIWNIDYVGKLGADYFDSNDEREQYGAIKRREWLTALDKSPNPEVQKKLAELQELAPEITTHPGEAIYIETAVGNESPIAAESLLNLSNAEIASYLTSFKSKDSFIGPNEEGLGASLQEAVTQSPDKFGDDLKPFLSVPRYYQYCIFLAFNTTVRNRRSLNWSNVLKFAIEIIALPNFWDEVFEEYHHHRNWVLGEIYSLIENGTKEDASAFDAGLLPLARELLLSTHLRAESSGNLNNDAITSVLNSNKGKMLVAMLNYSLRSARLENKTENRWDPAIMEDFTKRLDRDYDSDIDFSVVAGEYLPQLCYLDLDWVTKQLDRIIFWDTPEYGHAAMHGYLFFAQRVHANLFSLLKSRGHYARALDDSLAHPPEQPKWESALGVKKKFVRADDFTQRLVHHIAVGYLFDLDSIEEENSLIRKLLNAGSPWQLFELIDFIGRQPNDPSKWNKIDSLWLKIIEIIPNLDTDSSRELLGTLADWIKFVDRLDDRIMERLEPSAAAISGDLFAKDFLEELQRFLPNDAHHVAKLFLRMAQEPEVSTLQPEITHKLANNLAKAGETEIVKQVNNLYIQKGHYFLNDILKPTKV